MAYARFIDSDIYIYPNTNGYITCCACWLNESKSDYSLFLANVDITNDDELRDHLELHSKANHNMPIDLLQEILADPDRYGAAEQ